MVAENPVALHQRKLELRATAGCGEAGSRLLRPKAKWTAFRAKGPENGARSRRGLAAVAEASQHDFRLRRSREQPAKAPRLRAPHTALLRQKPRFLQRRHRPLKRPLVRTPQGVQVDAVRQQGQGPGGVFLNFPYKLCDIIP